MVKRLRYFNHQLGSGHFLTFNRGFPLFSCSVICSEASARKEMGGTQSSPLLDLGTESLPTIDLACLQCFPCSAVPEGLEEAEADIHHPIRWENKAQRSRILRRLVDDGKVRMVEVLLEKETFDMDDADVEGNTLLHRAARHGNGKMCEVLLAGGSTIKPNKQGQTPIDTARQHHHQDCVFILEPAAQRQAPAVDKSPQVLKQGVLALLNQHGAVHWSATGWSDHYAVVRGTTMELFHSKDEASAMGGQAARTVNLRQAKAFIPPIPMKTNNADRYTGEFCVMEYGSDAALHVSSCQPGQ